MCDCISYNKPEWGGTRPSALLPAPSWANGRPVICVDACMAGLIRALWDAGVKTRDCCCGHNRRIPHVMIENPDQVRLASEVVERVYTRSVHVIVWSSEADKSAPSSRPTSRRAETPARTD